VDVDLNTEFAVLDGSPPNACCHSVFKSLLIFHRSV